MLRIDYGCPDTCIWNSDLYFEEEFEMQWLQNPLNLRILREIDHAVPCAFGMQDIDDEELIFPITDISSGSKGLMLLNMTDNVEIWGTLFGDNCSDILLEIAKGKEIDLYLSHVLHFKEENFEAYSQNLHRPYNSYEEYISEAVKGVVGCI